MKLHEQTLHQLAAQKKLEDEYNDPIALPKVNKTNM